MTASGGAVTAIAAVVTRGWTSAPPSNPVSFVAITGNNPTGGNIGTGLTLNETWAGSANIAIGSGTDVVTFPTGTAATNLGLVEIPPDVGSADGTAAFQAKLNAGATAVYVAPGNHNLCGVVIPNTANLHIFGAGTPSQITQTACGSPVFSWSTAALAYPEQTISDLYFDSTLGTAHTINTSGDGGLTLRSLYFKNTPATFDNIYINGAAATIVHDVALEDILVYASGGGPAGNAFVEFGSLSADSRVIRLIGNGDFLTSYGVKIATGITGLYFSGNHPYNLATNVLYALSCNGCQFIGNTWDNASGGDVVYLNGVNYSTFEGDHVEAVNDTFNGINLVNASGNYFNGVVVSPRTTAANMALLESGTSDYNVFDGSGPTIVGDFTAPLFTFVGAHSYATHVAGYAPLGVNFGFAGVTTSAQAQGTTTYLGVNGSQAAYANTAYVTPYDSQSTGTSMIASIVVDNTPAAGQTFTYTLFSNTTNIGTCTISNTQFACTITSTTFVPSGHQVYLQSTFSATSGSANTRYSIQARG